MKGRKGLCWLTVQECSPPWQEVTAREEAAGSTAQVSRETWLLGEHAVRLLDEEEIEARADEIVHPLFSNILNKS